MNSEKESILPYYLREKRQNSLEANIVLPIRPFRPPFETNPRQFGRLEANRQYRIFPADPEISRHHVLCAQGNNSFASTASPRSSCLFPPGLRDPNISRFQLRRSTNAAETSAAETASVFCRDASAIQYLENPPITMENGSGVNTWDCSDGMHVNVATAHTRGRRNEMEDVFIEYKSHGSDALGNIYVFGVCDGHGGSAVSDWLHTNLGPIVANSLRLGLSLQQAFSIVQAQLEKQIDPSSAAGMGSTACITVILPKHNLYYIANCGDSRCVLIDLLNPSDFSRRITVDHKPEEPTEKARIEQNGGAVISLFGISRINGCLSVSRGFGDGSMRPFGFTEQPDVFGPFVLQERYALVLACDGLFDVVTDVGVAKTAAHYLSGCVSPVTLEKSVIVERAVQQLRNLAFASDSGDNISVMLVVPWKK